MRAVEYRVRKIPQAQLTEIVNTAEGNGYVLLRPLLQALSKFEKIRTQHEFLFSRI